MAYSSGHPKAKSTPGDGGQVSNHSIRRIIQNFSVEPRNYTQQLRRKDRQGMFSAICNSDKDLDKGDKLVENSTSSDQSFSHDLEQNCDCVSTFSVGSPLWTTQEGDKTRENSKRQNYFRGKYSHITKEKLFKLNHSQKNKETLKEYIDYSSSPHPAQSLNWLRVDKDCIQTSSINPRKCDDRKNVRTSVVTKSDGHEYSNKFENDTELKRAAKIYPHLFTPINYVKEKYQSDSTTNDNFVRSRETPRLDTDVSPESMDIPNCVLGMLKNKVPKPNDILSESPFVRCGSALAPADVKSMKFRVRECDGENLSLEQSGVTLTLLNTSLWKAFDRIGTEMIINRGGRRMFPYLSLSVKGLGPGTLYTVSVQIVPASSRRYKFINSKWVPVGLADTEPPQLPYFHVDSPSSGQHWNRSKINFSKIKLTNNKDSSPQNMLLHSMHKYKIITTFTRLDLADDQSANYTLSFYFPETDFIAVTAYQNESVTQMKIHNNPFAKAFRDAKFTEIRRSTAFRKRKYTSVPKARGRPDFSRAENATVTSSRPGDEIMCRLVTPMALPVSMDPGFQWTPFDSTGCLVSQYHGVGYCLPWRGLPGYHESIYPSIQPVGSANTSDNDSLTSFRAGHHFLTGGQNDPSGTRTIQALKRECSKDEDLE